MRWLSVGPPEPSTATWRDRQRSSRSHSCAGRMRVPGCLSDRAHVVSSTMAVRSARGCSRDAASSDRVSRSQVGLLGRRGAHLHEFGTPVGVIGDEIDLESLGRLEVGDRRPATGELVEHDRLERVAGVRATARVEGLDEARVGGIELARVGVASSLGFGGDGNGGNQECVDQMVEHRVHGVLADGETLRLEVGVHPARAERSAGVAERLTDDPPQRGWLRDAVSLDDVAEEHGVDIALEERDARAAIERSPDALRSGLALRFGKASDREVFPQAVLHLVSSDCRQRRDSSVGFLAAMTERLAETERADRRGHGSAPERRVDLPRQHLGGRSRYHDVDGFGVEHSTNEPIPPRHELNLVEEPRAPFALAALGMANEVFLQQRVEVPRVDVRQAVVVETQVDRPFRGCEAATIGEELLQEAGLPRATHPDHGVCLAGYARQRRVSMRQGDGPHRGQGIVQPLSQGFRKGSCRKDSRNCPSQKDSSGSNGLSGKDSVTPDRGCSPVRSAARPSCRAGRSSTPGWRHRGRR